MTDPVARQRHRAGGFVFVMFVVALALSACGGVLERANVAARVEEIRFEGAGVWLAGTVTAPAVPGRHPAVVLLSGSGAQDRDSSGAGHQPFRVLAEALTAAGVVVLRADDRGVGGSTGSSESVTYDELANDALAGVRLLAGRPDVDPGRIGVLAHSEGGFVAPRAVSRGAAGEIGYVGLLHTPAVSGHRTLIEQTERTVTASGAPGAEVERAVSAAQTIADSLLGDGAGDVVALRAEAELIGIPPDQAEAALPALRRYVRHDPAAELDALEIPVLALFGGADLMTPPDSNEPAARAALADNPAASVHTLRGINHVLQPARTGLPAEYSQITTTVDPAVIDLVVDWVVRR